MMEHQHPPESSNAKEVKHALEEQWNDQENAPSNQEAKKCEKEMDLNQKQEFSANPVQDQDNALLDELDKVKTERDEYLSDLKRLQAEFNNFRKRSVKERSEMREYLMQDFITRILGVVENLERAINPDIQAEDLESYRSGVVMVYQQLMGILGEIGLTKIEAKGETFDPNLHEAVSEIETDEHEPGTIINELTPGYKLKDRVIKAPKVQIAKTKGEMSDKE